MARKARAEVEGGLYHLITRGNNRRQIFHSSNDYEKFLKLLLIQKTRLPFFLYAYCLMTNHVHLLIERRTDTVGRIMHRVLTGYSQYYNRRYGRVGHVLQGRHKAILCQSERYLKQLVRYIHLNPVRAKMVDLPEQYEYSGHRAYLGTATPGLVDIDPVLRHFAVKKSVARERYRQFVMAGIKQGHHDELYPADDGRMLGTEEFIDATIHRIGETRWPDRKTIRVETNREINPEALIEAVENICGIPKEKFCASDKSLDSITAKEMLILIGREMGASVAMLSAIMGISNSAVSRRNDAAKDKVQTNPHLSKLAASIRNHYRQRD